MLVNYRTQRWEAHIWQEGKQIYLGGFDAEEQAALAYDLAALKFRGPDAQINFDISNYQQELLHFNDVSTSCVTSPPGFMCISKYLIHTFDYVKCHRSQKRRLCRTCGGRARGIKRRAVSSGGSRFTRRANGRRASVRWSARSISASTGLLQCICLTAAYQVLLMLLRHRAWLDICSQGSQHKHTVLQGVRT
jgi:hypothetical protein